MEDWGTEEWSTPEPTGLARVDAVVAAVATLEDRPLVEHTEVFESAAAELRATLEAPERG